MKFENRSQLAKRICHRMYAAQDSVPLWKIVDEETAALTAEVERLRLDKARLDWLIENDAGVNFGPMCHPGQAHCWIHSAGDAVHFYGKTAREAIDAARDSQSPQPPLGLSSQREEKL